MSGTDEPRGPRLTGQPGQVQHFNLAVLQALAAMKKALNSAQRAHDDFAPVKKTADFDHPKKKALLLAQANLVKRRAELDLLLFDDDLIEGDTE